MIIWLSGTPGVGKTEVGKRLAKKLGYKFIDLPVFVKKTKIAEKSGDVLIVDPTRLKEKLQTTDDVVISSHIVVRLPRKNQRCFVLRCNPLKLLRRLRSRGYDFSKIAENVEAEFLGVVYADAIKVFGRRNVVQIDTTGKNVSQTSKKCMMVLNGKSTGDSVDWLVSLNERELESLLLFLARRGAGLSL